MPLSIIDLKYSWTLDFIELIIVTLCKAKYVLVMVEYFSKLIVLTALPQNSLELATIALFYYIQIYLEIPIEALMD